MSERFSPEIKYMRQEAAKKIRKERRHDRYRTDSRGIDYSRSRGVGEYIGALQGVRHFFSYARSLSPNQTSKVLDIGAGSTRADAELQSLSEFSSNVLIEATSLARDKEVDKYLGRQRLHLTSVEYLNGIKDGEMAGIISVYGIMNTSAPELAAQSINRVLLPSGALKTVFTHRIDKSYASEDDQIIQRRFIRALKNLSFDVATRKVRGIKDLTSREVYNTVITAIKSPGAGLNAETLLSLDWDDEPNQEAKLQTLGFKDVNDEVNARHPLTREAIEALLKDISPEDEPLFREQYQNNQDVRQSADNGLKYLLDSGWDDLAERYAKAFGVSEKTLKKIQAEE